MNTQMPNYVVVKCNLPVSVYFKQDFEGGYVDLRPMNGTHLVVSLKRWPDIYKILSKCISSGFGDVDMYISVSNTAYGRLSAPASRLMPSKYIDDGLLGVFRVCVDGREIL